MVCKLVTQKGANCVDRKKRLDNATITMGRGCVSYLISILLVRGLQLAALRLAQPLINPQHSAKYHAAAVLVA